MEDISPHFRRYRGQPQTSLLCTSRGSHTRALQHPSESCHKSARLRGEGRAASECQNQPGPPPGHRRLVFSCIQQPRFTLPDSDITSLRSFSYASSFPSISHPRWTHKSNWRGQVPNNHSFQSDLSDSHLSHFPLTPCHTTSCTTFAPLTPTP